MDRSNTSLLAPRNDAEAATILDIARRLGLDVRESNQPWGATLEKEPSGNFLNFKQNVIIVEMPGVQKEEELRRSHTLFILDHHKYEMLDRTNPQSSLEQFAELVGYTLNRREMGIALNDRGYIPALEANGFERNEIDEIRKFDLSCQGYTDEAFAQQESEYAQGTLALSDLFVLTTSF
jgi:hypothetical protein